LNIYIYGNKNFVNKINSLFRKTEVHDCIEHIKTLHLLETTIKENSDDIFIIDQDKIIYNELLHKLNPLKQKDLIKKDFLDKYGIEDVCFNSMDGLVSYVVDKFNRSNVEIDKQIDDEDDENELQDDEDIDKSNEEEQTQIEEPKEILTIDDIDDLQMQEAVGILDNNDTQKD